MVEKLTYACATKVYPNSYGLQKYILENNLTSKNKLKVIGYGSSNGIDTNHFKNTDEVLEQSKKIKNKYDLKNQFVFCFVGRVVKDKGIDELSFSFDKLTKEFKNIKLLIVGKFEEDLDPISEECYDIVESNNNIINVGFQNDIRPFLASSDCFVLPTYREGFPNVVLQACSMELPCIVSNINGCNEIIENNTNGLIVEPKNKDELYNAMKKFLVDKSLAGKLSSNTRDDIIKKHDRKQFFKCLLDEYNEILK